MNRVQRKTDIDIQNAVEYLQDYWKDYSSQSGYTKFSDQTFVDDALYAIGVSINKNEYSAAQGFDKFKKWLQHHLMPTFQERVQPWMRECFGAEISADTVERNHRFLEESLELVQACGCTASEAHQLVDYVFGRPVGEPQLEAGGVMVTLAALCLAQQIDMHRAGETELTRIWGMIEQIRDKQANKPKHSPLPQAAP